MQLLHYSKRKEGANVDGIKRYILFHHQRHPRDMGAAEIEAFLTFLATVRQLASSSQNQTLSAIQFLDKFVQEIKLPRVDFLRAKRPERLPSCSASRKSRASLTTPRRMSSTRLSGIQAFSLNSTDRVEDIGSAASSKGSTSGVDPVPDGFLTE